MNKGKIFSISISPKRGQLKGEVSHAIIIENFGIENDGHAGSWGRQVTCLDWSSFKKIGDENNIDLKPGEMAENVLIEGLDFSLIVVGSRLKLGKDVILEVTQIGKEDHPSVVSKRFGFSLLPYEGLFCKVIKSGFVNKGDKVEQIN